MNRTCYCTRIIFTSIKYPHFDSVLFPAFVYFDIALALFVFVMHGFFYFMGLLLDSAFVLWDETSVRHNVVVPNPKKKNKY